MANTRTLINKVLRGIRQFGLLIDSSTTAITDEYLQMVLQFLNEAKEEIEESGWPWQALRKTVTVTLAAAQVEYTITIAGDADVDTTDRSRLLYENVNSGGRTEAFYNSVESRIQVFDVTTSTEYRLREVTQEQMERWHFTDNNETDRPHYITFYSDGASLKAKVYPIPDAAYTLKCRIYIPEAELTAADITTSVSIPERAVWLKALYKANEERGSELGKPGSTLEKAYMDAQVVATGKEMTTADYTVHLER